MHRPEAADAGAGAHPSIPGFAVRVPCSLKLMFWGLGFMADAPADSPHANLEPQTPDFKACALYTIDC